MNQDGILCESFVETKFKSLGYFTKLIHTPADLLINKELVEIKGAKLFIKSKNKIVHGRYEFHSLKQLQKIKSMNIWVCFVIHLNETCLIQGFIKSSKLPNKRYISINLIQKELISLKDFMRMANVSK